LAEVVNNSARLRFELVENGALAFATYRPSGAILAIPHVEAAPELRGTGAAGRLMAGIVAYARAHELKIAPVCPYAVHWFQRNPAAGDVLA
jgi:predicted GNAT family acetyltransferase